MGNFRQGNSRGGFDRGSRSGGSRFGGRSGGSRFGGRDRDSERFERRPLEMHDATCSKCGKRCQVPFRPTGSKPVFCSDCFRQNESSGSNFVSRNKDKAFISEGSSEQFNKINTKLDKILKVLQDLEIDSGEDTEEGSDDTETES